jgi:hypothetical protein
MSAKRSPSYMTRKLVNINNTFSDKVCVLLYTMLQSSAWTYYNLFIFEKYQRQTIVSKSSLNIYK